MVVRTWCATASSAGAHAYHRYFADTLLPQLRGLPGFAGEDITPSVVEPEAQAMLLKFDRTVSHRRVLVDAAG
jgi:hypothetical protein